MKPIAVYRDGNTWRWLCRTCSRSEWVVRHLDAVDGGLQHLRSHVGFGFGGKW